MQLKTTPAFLLVYFATAVFSDAYVIPLPYGATALDEIPWASYICSEDSMYEYFSSIHGSQYFITCYGGHAQEFKCPNNLVVDLENRKCVEQVNLLQREDNNAGYGQYDDSSDEKIFMNEESKLSNDDVMTNRNNLEMKADYSDDDLSWLNDDSDENDNDEDYRFAKSDDILSYDSDSGIINDKPQGSAPIESQSENWGAPKDDYFKKLINWNNVDENEYYNIDRDTLIGDDTNNDKKGAFFSGLGDEQENGDYDLNEGGDGDNYNEEEDNQQFLSLDGDTNINKLLLQNSYGQDDDDDLNQGDDNYPQNSRLQDNQQFLNLDGDTNIDKLLMQNSYGQDINNNNGLENQRNLETVANIQLVNLNILVVGGDEKAVVNGKVADGPSNVSKWLVSAARMMDVFTGMTVTGFCKVFKC